MRQHYDNFIQKIKDSKTVIEFATTLGSITLAAILLVNSILTADIRRDLDKVIEASQKMERTVDEKVRESDTTVKDYYVHKAEDNQRDVDLQNEVRKDFKIITDWMARLDGRLDK